MHRVPQGAADAEGAGGSQTKRLVGLESRAVGLVASRYTGAASRSTAASRATGAAGADSRPREGRVIRTGNGKDVSNSDSRMVLYAVRSVFRGALTCRAQGVA